jgi:hypothetical protein
MTVIIRLVGNVPKVVPGRANASGYGKTCMVLREFIYGRLGLNLPLVLIFMN